MAVIRLVAAVLLGLFITWLWSLWRGQFDNLYVASAIWCAICLFIAWLYDRLGLFRQANQETSERDRQN